jgi:hypothetical protein
VAQALALETNEGAKRAAIHVLGTRAQKRKAGDISGRFKAVQPRITGQLLTMRTREDIQLDAPEAWKEAAYSPDIDELLAEIALDPIFPDIAELAARTIGRIRSLAALKAVAEAQRKGTKGALRALALIRDEAPSLPNVVSLQARVYAYVANTWRRLTDDPLQNVWRFVFALIGSTAAMAVYVWILFRTEAIFNPERWGKTISIGLTFGMLMAVLVMLAGELPARLRHFWPWWGRLGVSGILGFLWGALVWGAFTWFFLNYPPDWDVMVFAGLGTALGFVLTAMFALRGWVAFLLTAVATYIPIYIMYQYGSGLMTIPFELTQVPLLYFNFPEQVFTLAIPVVVLIALGGHAQSIWRDVRSLVKRIRAR